MKKSQMPENLIWRAMKNRCSNPRNPQYETHGACGIRVCDQWRDSFDVFIADLGLRPSAAHRLRRKDRTKDYAPDNCGWFLAEEYNEWLEEKREAESKVIPMEEWNQQVSALTGGEKTVEEVALELGPIPEDEWEEEKHAILDEKGLIPRRHTVRNAR